MLVCSMREVIFHPVLRKLKRMGALFAAVRLQVAPVFAITGKPLTPNTGQRYGASSEPGGTASAYAELSALFAVIGTPAWACIEGVRSEAWRRYLFHIPGRSACTFILNVIELIGLSLNRQVLELDNYPRKTCSTGLSVAAAVAGPYLELKNSIS